MTALATHNPPTDANQIESTPRLRLFVGTTAAPEAILASGELVSKDWHSILCAMYDWAKHPELFAADDFSPPSSPAIAKASIVAKALQMQNYDVPVRVVPSADEGIVFEWKYEGAYRTIEVQADGSVELLDHQNGQLDRRRLDI